MACWRTCSAGTTTAWYALSEKTQVQMMVCTIMTCFLFTFSWSSSLLVRSPLSLTLDQKACKKNTFFFSQHRLFRSWHVSLTIVFQGGAHFQEIGGPQDPGLELYWSSSLLPPLVPALAGGERLLPDVHEQRQRTHQLCAAL